MDGPRFDDVLRAVTTSRRQHLAGLLALAAGCLALPGVDARKKRRKKKRRKRKCKRNCADRTCGNDGCGGSCGICDGGEVCHGGTCCRPEPRAATCAGRCGTRTNTCGQPVTCCTDAGQHCLSNGSCAIVCATNDDCNGCNGCSNPSVEGERHCIVGPLQPFVTCATTDDCPPGSHCQDIGNGGICIELCA